jgi:hypothetical protein
MKSNSEQTPHKKLGVYSKYASLLVWIQTDRRFDVWNWCLIWKKILTNDSLCLMLRLKFLVGLFFKAVTLPYLSLIRKPVFGLNVYSVLVKCAVRARMASTLWEFIKKCVTFYDTLQQFVQQILSLHVTFHQSTYYQPIKIVYISCYIGKLLRHWKMWRHV